MKDIVTELLEAQEHGDLGDFSTLLSRAAREITRLRNELAAHDALCHPEAFEETGEHAAVEGAPHKPGCE